MFKSIYNKILSFKENKDLKKKGKDWSFKNAYQFLKYCDLMNEKDLLESYNNILKSRELEIIPVERKIKSTVALTGKAINARQLKIMMEIISKNNINDIKKLNKKMLYNEIIKHFEKKCKKDENEKCDYIDLFREMYSLDLETSAKINLLIDKYLTSLGVNK